MLQNPKHQGNYLLYFIILFCCCIGISCKRNVKIVSLTYNDFFFHKLKPFNSEVEEKKYFLKSYIINNEIKKIEFFNRSKILIKADTLIYFGNRSYHLTSVNAYRNNLNLRMFTITFLESESVIRHNLLYYKKKYFLISIDSFEVNKEEFVRKFVNLNDKVKIKYNSIYDFINKYEKDISSLTFYKEKVKFIFKYTESTFEFKLITLCDWCISSSADFTKVDKYYGNLFLDLEKLDVKNERDTLFFKFSAIPVSISKIRL